MDFLLFWGIISIIVVVVVGFKTRDFHETILLGFITVLIGTLILSFYIKNINYANLSESLGVIINDKMTDEQIENEISLLVTDESKGKLSAKVKIEDKQTGSLKFKRVELKIKNPILFKGLYLNNTKTFKIVIKDEDIKNNNIKIIGLE